MFSRIPLTALRAFESAARLGTFKAAANELSVTPTAISHQVRSLESWIGALLFERQAAGVALTPAGRQLFTGCHYALCHLSDSLEAARPQVVNENLVLTTTPAFAATWLIPRLDGFHDRHPNLQIAVETSDSPVDLERDARVDLAIRTTTRDYPALTQRELFSEYFGVYGTADFDADNRNQPLNLIAVRWSTPSPISVSWPAWCEIAGRQDWLTRAVFRNYDDEHYALQAALHARGAVLASTVLVAEHVQSGALRPIQPEMRIPGAHYLALCRPGRERSAPVRAFLDWLAEEATKTRAILEGPISR